MTSDASDEMRAVVWTAYGPPDVLQLRDVPRPVPGPNEILVRVRATTATAGEIEMRRGTHRGLLGLMLRLFLGIRRPRGTRIPGQELAGDVVEIGGEVTRFAAGDQVVAQTGLRFGGDAEFACLSESGAVVEMSDRVSYEEATTLPTGGLYARYFVRTAGIEPGDSVLINGAGGSIGTYAIQLAKRAGAEVTAVDRADKLDLLRAIGADHVIDHTTHDFTEDTTRYDVILDVIDASSFGAVARSLRPGGRYLHSDVSPLAAIRRKLHRGDGGKRAVFVRAGSEQDDLRELVDMLGARELRAVIDRRFPLEEVADAHAHAETGAKRGHIVISVGGGSG